MTQMCCQLVPWFYDDVWGPYSLCDEESLKLMTRVLVLWRLLEKGINEQAMVRLSKTYNARIRRRNVDVKGNMYEYLTSLRWKFVR